jgi:hypothetical protein
VRDGPLQVAADEEGDWERREEKKDEDRKMRKTASCANRR